MTYVKNVYALMLALVIVLSGCFGLTADDTDGQSNANSNIAPLIEVGSGHADAGTPVYSSSTGDLTGYSHWNISLYRAVKDLDGSIASSGWDFDLDGVIDQSSTGFRSVDTLSIPSAHWVNASTISGYSLDTAVGELTGMDWDQLEDLYGFSDFQVATIAFIATDDSGTTSGEMTTVNNLMYYLLNYEGDSGGGNGCAETCNTYTAEDAAAMTDSGDDNALISVRWQHAEEDLNWAFVVMKLSVGDNTYDCAIDGSQECQIGQDGDDDSLWETGEFLLLSESGTDIADGATNIDIYISYRGVVVAGDDDVTVS